VWASKSSVCEARKVSILLIFIPYIFITYILFIWSKIEKNAKKKLMKIVGFKRVTFSILARSVRSTTLVNCVSFLQTIWYTKTSIDFVASVVLLNGILHVIWALFFLMNYFLMIINALFKIFAYFNAYNRTNNIGGHKQNN